MVRLGTLVSRPVIIAAVLGFFALIFALGPTFILQTQADDQTTVVSLAHDALYIDNATAGYRAVAIIYALTPLIAQRIIVLVLGILFILQMMSKLKQPSMLLVSAFLCISPIILFLTLFVKDTFVTVMVLSVLQITNSRMSRLTKLILVSVTYFIFAFVFRSYYYLVLAIALMFEFSRFFGPRLRLSLIMLFLIGLVLVPSGLWHNLQSSRDIFNFARTGKDLRGTRTAFTNPLEPDNLLAFIVNYFYAVVRLNFPFFFTGFGVREIFLQGTLITVFWLSWAARKLFSDERVRLPLLLLFSEFLVMMIFEPDLGSYLRHLSSFFPYLSPVMIAMGSALPAIAGPNWRLARLVPRIRLSPRPEAAVEHFVKAPPLPLESGSAEDVKSTPT